MMPTTCNLITINLIELFFQDGKQKKIHTNYCNEMGREKYTCAVNNSN